jgi:hypothetical protein
MAQIFTIFDAMIACGVDNVVLFMEETQAQRIADDIFDNLFTTCKDMTFKELDDHFKTYSELNVAQGQIRLRPGVQKTSRLLSSGHVTSCVLDVTRVLRHFLLTKSAIS